MFLRNVTLDILQTLEFLLDSVATSAEEQPHLIGAVLSQMLADGGRVKGRHHPGLPALAPRADGAVECGGVHDVVVVGGELVPVLHHHVLQHLLDCVVVGEAGGVRLQTRLALERLVPVGLLDVADVLGHQDVVPAVAAPGGGPQGHHTRPVELLVVLLDVLEPLPPLGVGEGGVAAAAGQLQLADHLALVSHGVTQLKMLLNVPHVLLEITPHPEASGAKKKGRQTQFAVDPVQVSRHVHVGGDGLGDGDIEPVLGGQVLQQHLDTPGQGGLDARGALGAAEHVAPVAELHVIHQVIIRLAGPHTKWTDQGP